jgi:hypothetical protein
MMAGRAHFCDGIFPVWHKLDKVFNIRCSLKASFYMDVAVTVVVPDDIMQAIDYNRIIGLSTCPDGGTGITKAPANYCITSNSA